MIDEKFIVNIKGKNFVVYEGLLSEAHHKGLSTLQVTIVQFPTSENGKTCICRATATGKEGQIYSDYGDASPDSVDSKIIPHIIRMAATRAKARCLRDFTNIGLTCLEEIIQSDRGVEELATLPQINLLQKLAKEKKVDLDLNGLTKEKASKLIDEINKRNSIGDGRRVNEGNS